MDLQSIRYAGERLIESYGDGGFRLTDSKHQGSIRIMPHSGVEDIDCASFDDLDRELLAPFMEAKDELEIVLIGTGEKQKFPSLELRQWFMQAGLALEFMDTGAACRTFNVLVSEDRRVAALLIAV